MSTLSGTNPAVAVGIRICDPSHLWSDQYIDSHFVKLGLGTRMLIIAYNTGVDVISVLDLVRVLGTSSHSESGAAAAEESADTAP